jgi:uncharacterized protein (TIGR02996 family)
MDAKSAFFRHVKRPQWGSGVVVREDAISRTFLFEDGKQRTFKREICDEMLEQTAAPQNEVDAVRLERGRAGAEVAPKAINLELEQAIRDSLRAESPEPDSPAPDSPDSPDPVAPYLVYADWLQGRQDPRGELITIQHGLMQTPESRKLKQAQNALLKRVGEYLLPQKIAALCNHRSSKTLEPYQRMCIDWHLGFLREVHLAHHRTADVIDGLVDLLRHPSAHFLQRLSVGPLAELTDYREIIATLAKWAPRQLASLEIVGHPQKQALPYYRLGDVGALFQIADLQHLSLCGGSIQLNKAVRHEKLSMLSIRATQLAQTTLQRVVRAKLPRLRELELSVLGLELGPKITKPLLDETSVPELSCLRLRHLRRPAELISSLAASNILLQLRVLDLRGGLLTSDAVASLLRHRNRFANLETLLLTAPGASGSRDNASGLRAMQAPDLQKRLLDALPNVQIERAVERVTLQAVFARVPDPQSLQAAAKLADPDNWLLLSRGKETAWGQIEGRDYYEVYADLHSLETGCTCPSFKDPCKHALALLMLLAEDRVSYNPTPPPDLSPRLFQPD